MAKQAAVGAEAVEAKGWIRAHKWLLLRRISQIGILALFLISPYLVDRLDGTWVVKGNLASSMTLDVLPLTDPHILLQAILTGITPHKDAVIGVVIVLVFYLLVGGRVYCSWVCPVNMVTDAASWLRRRFGIRGGARIDRSTRYWMLAMTLVLPLATGAIVWELFNPVSLAFRGIVFGMGLGWMVLLGVFLFDLLVSREGWCGRLCPVGAFYALVGKASLLRVVADKREQCDDCMDCFAVCPEQKVIRPALKGADKGIGPVILAGECTNCGRCIDVCAEDVFRFGSRFSKQKVVDSGERETAGEESKPFSDAA
ncbi:MAG TPA: quinol dehydrogenase ferredoxin subunit NapH [Sedimenticola thiotaurini]|uniref:Quinol dehydrogenase ferredoxin subunit NapH n=1 Tax=Sedimenticola thiotaurini TaxID=1543721 RepID=A0A831W3S9_9GAMM|nr:quinol dehydrogenase ferredoxin subunit NapH [Sedimenticola thiotaurini]